MELVPTAIPDVKLIKPRVFGDHRGFFLETWNAQTFAQLGLDVPFVQDNHSRSVGPILRGLHYQVQQPQGKLVRCTHGAIWDVAVDLRRSSPTFGRSVAARLDGIDHHMLWVPPGFAHGFLVLSDEAEVLYKCTDFYAPTHDRTLLWNDPALEIAWPLPAGVAPILSSKDVAGIRLADAETYA